MLFQFVFLVNYSLDCGHLMLLPRFRTWRNCIVPVRFHFLHCRISSLILKLDKSSLASLVSRNTGWLNRGHLVIIQNPYNRESAKTHVVFPFVIGICSLFVCLFFNLPRYPLDFIDVFIEDFGPDWNILVHNNMELPLSTSCPVSGFPRTIS